MDSDLSGKTTCLIRPFLSGRRGGLIAGFTVLDLIVYISSLIFHKMYILFTVTNYIKTSYDQRI